MQVRRKCSRNARPVRLALESLESRCLLSASGGEFDVPGAAILLGNDGPLLPPTRFAVIGDYGWEGARAEAVSEMVKGWDPEFIITTGDNNYDYGAAETIDQNIGQYYHEYIGDYQGGYGAGAEINRFFPTLGNHDWRAKTDGLPKPYLDYFTLPGNERYYDFRWGPVHFFMTDTDSDDSDGITADSLQAQWLKSALADSDAPWKLVVPHNAPYSSGNLHGSNEVTQWPYKLWGADAVLAGHEHTYERLWVDDFLYLVNGLGGRRGAQPLWFRRGGGCRRKSSAILRRLRSDAGGSH